MQIIGILLCILYDTYKAECFGFCVSNGTPNLGHKAGSNSVKKNWKNETFPIEEFVFPLDYGVKLEWTRKAKYLNFAIEIEEIVEHEGNSCSKYFCPLWNNL